MQRRYRALRLIGTLYKLLGVIILILAILAALAFCGLSSLGGAALTQFNPNTPNLPVPIAPVAGGIVTGVIALLYGGLTGLALYGFGEGIYVLLALEENTRVTANLLQQSARAPAPVPQPIAPGNPPPATLPPGNPPASTPPANQA